MKTKEHIENLVDLIKGTIYCDLRQKFEAAEVLEVYSKIDEAAKKYKEEFCL